MPTTTNRRKNGRQFLNLTISDPAEELLREIQHRTGMRPGQVISRLLYEHKAREEGRQEESAKIRSLLMAEVG